MSFPRFSSSVHRILFHSVVNSIFVFLIICISFFISPQATVEFLLPFDEEPKRTDIDLAVLLPRVLKLAESKGDAQLRVLASECIHGIILCMIGASATDPSRAGGDSSRGKTYAELYRHVFPTILKLALDLNPVTRQLFQQLLSQIIHWFSRDRSGQPETAALLDCLTDGLSSTESGPVRAFCAKCFGEFLSFAIRQASKKQMAESPFGVQQLLTRLERLARHPNRSGMIGGSTYWHFAEGRKAGSIVLCRCHSTALCTAPDHYLCINGG
jgi:DNA-dependent protein kinase catalytic subunit